MGKKRRKASFLAVTFVEEKDKRWKDSPTQKKRRKSSMTVVADVERNGGVQKKPILANDLPQEIENDNSKVPDTEVESFLKVHDTDGDKYNECTSDEDIFADNSIGTSVVDSRCSSPVLQTKFLSPICKKSSMKSPSMDWGGDDSLIARCSERLLTPTSHTKGSSTNLRNSQMKQYEKKNSSRHATNPNDNRNNDSVFGDIDLSLLENKVVNSSKRTDTPPHNKACRGDSLLQATAIFVHSTKTVEDNVKDTRPSTCEDGSVKNPQPIAASTPSRASDRRKSLLETMTDRFKANANQQTATSFRSYEAAKVFPELLQDFSDTSQNIAKSIGPFYGLPMRVKELMLSTRGIKKFYDWQDKCLTLPSVLKGKNLIYSLPTSGGKTLVAEMLIMKELLGKEKDAMLVLPFVAIVQEKVRDIAQFAVELDFLVEEYAGSKGKFPPTKRRKRKSLFVCTIEKANTLVNSLIEAGRLDSVGLVVVDELHMLGEGGKRGATVEMMLAKIMHVSSSTQIIGMSATLSNIEDLSKFLKAEIYTNNFRPVILNEYVKSEDTIYKVDAKTSDPEEGLELDRVIDFPNKEMADKDTDHLATLVMEVIPDHSCLIFCPTKKNCENVAVMICKLLPKSLKDIKTKEKHSILDTLYQDSGGEGVCPVLMKTLPYGVAYHHSGLTSDERTIIENAYNDGVLCVITCTSTLAAGVNLPARRVIIRSPYVGREFISKSKYKQMIGRAGRAGIDTKGESYLILTKKQDKQKVMDLVTGPIETCVSSLMYDGGKGFKTLTLNLISLKIMTKISDVMDFFRCTLISVQLDSMPNRFSYISALKKDTTIDEKEVIESVTKNALQELLSLKLIRIRKLKEESEGSVDAEDCHLEITKLGAATNRGSIDFSISSNVYDDLVVGLKSLVLANYLHLLYLVTPFEAKTTISPDWMIYFEEYGKLTTDEQTAATVIGVPENYLATKAAGNRVRNKKFKDEVIKRFYVTLMLYHLFRGKSVWHVADRFNQPRGYLQSLLSSSAAFASCVLHFTKELEEFWPYHSLLENLIQALQYCTSAELLPLMEIPGVKIARAKQLHNAGYKTLAHVAKADIPKLVRAIEHLSRKQALQITASAKVLLKEKVEELQAEAEALQTVPGLT